MLATQDKIKKYSLQMEEKDVAIKQLKSRLLRSEEDHFKTLEEVKSSSLVCKKKFSILCFRAV